MHLSVLFLLACCACLSVALKDGYKVVPGFGIYRYSRVKMTWNVARTDCENDGGHLAVINSAGEAQALAKFFIKWRAPTDDFITFIGFEDKAQEGVYMTVKGTTLSQSGYDTWKYPPKGSSSNLVKDCGGLIVCGRLTDMFCQIPNTFICEID